MNMNPMMLLQMKAGWERFKTGHPKFPRFLKAVSQNALTEGTVIEIRVTAPGGRDYCSNLKLKPDDMELIEQFKELFQSPT